MLLSSTKAGTVTSYSEMLRGRVSLSMRPCLFMYRGAITRRHLGGPVRHAGTLALPRPASNLAMSASAPFRMAQVADAFPLGRWSSPVHPLHSELPTLLGRGQGRCEASKTNETQKHHADSEAHTIRSAGAVLP